MNFKFLLVLCLLVFLIACKSEPTIVLSFDEEFPIGIGFPDSFTIEQEAQNTPIEIKWENTVNRINDIGQKYNVRFQFNVVGITAEDNQELIKNLSENHDISCHSYSHKNLAELDNTRLYLELKRCKSALERITGKEIVGNRFPYTNHSEESFRALKDLKYEWDSSVWQEREMLIPSYYRGLTEYPLAPIPDDWTYFIRDSKTDAEEYFSLIEEELSKTPEDSIFIVVLHPWVLAADDSRLDALEKFVSRHKNIKSIDQLQRS